MKCIFKNIFTATKQQFLSFKTLVLCPDAFSSSVSGSSLQLLNKLKDRTENHVGQKKHINIQNIWVSSFSLDLLHIS